MLNFEWLSGISPGAAKSIFLVLFVLIGGLVLLIPREYIFAGVREEERHWWKNLKWWAIGVLVIIFYVYYLF